LVRLGQSILNPSASTTGVQKATSASRRRRNFSGVVSGLASRPAIQAMRAAVENLAYDSHTRLFHFDLVAKPGTSPVVTLWAHPKRASFGGSHLTCGPRPARRRCCHRWPRRTPPLDSAVWRKRWWTRPIGTLYWSATLSLTACFVARQDNV